MAANNSSNIKGIAALNVYKKVALVRRSSDTLTYEDNEGNTKTIKDLGEAVSSAVPSLQPKVKLDIPTPRIVDVDSYQKDMPPSYQPPTSYIRYQKHEEHEMEYVADAEDEVWLHNNTKFGMMEKEHQKKSPQITLELLERMLDLLEKATGFETIITTDQAERLLLNKIPQLLHLFPYKAPAGVVTTKHVINDVYSYWVQKRSKLKRPLLRKFWPVTASDDTNPHLVFRPREKEKYKLRKKRQNDVLSFQKMKQLRADFAMVKTLLELVKRREELNLLSIQLQAEWWEQCMFDVVDTSGIPRTTTRVQRPHVERLLDIPKYFFAKTTGTAVNHSTNNHKRKKRKRGHEWETAATTTTTTMTTLEPAATMPTTTATVEQLLQDQKMPPSTMPPPPPPVVNVAGKNHGEPAPLFIHPLKSRESYTTSWDNAVPLITSYVNTHAAPTFRFRHRPRLGRGGRICVDRIPQPPNTIAAMTVFTAGNGLVRSVEPKKQLVDLLPRPLDHAALSRRIEEECVSAIAEETAAGPAAGRASSASGAAVDAAEDNDCEEVLVKLDDWLDTDEQLWGEERFAIGPL